METQYTEFERTGLGLPLLDSFIKESARLTPVESSKSPPACQYPNSMLRYITVSMRRCATQPFAFSDGTALAVGDWACVPVKAIMQDSRYYPDPLAFNGFRFASPNALEGTSEMSTFRFLQPKPSRFVDADQSFHVWGTGRMTW